MEVSFSDANLTTRVRAVRNICLVALLFVLPITASAQQRRQDDRRSHDRQSSQSDSGRRTDERRADQGRSDQRRSDHKQSDHRQSDREPSEQRQSDPRSWSLPSIGLPPASPTQVPWWERRQVPAWEQKQVPAWERPQVPAWETKNPARTLLNQARDERRLAKAPRPNQHRPPVVYVLPPYRYFDPGTTLSYGVASSTAYITPPPPQVIATQPAAPLVDTGFLRLEVEPRVDLQVFVDGLYLGTIADLGEELELRLGVRRIELRAPGHRTLVFETEIVSDRTIVYRGTLEPIASAPRAPAAPISSATPASPVSPANNKIFLIPGCYLGNVLPTAAMMRPGCDLNKLTTISR
jgi:hypothetical protein